MGQKRPAIHQSSWYKEQRVTTFVLAWFAVCPLCLGMGASWESGPSWGAGSTERGILPVRLPKGDRARCEVTVKCMEHGEAVNVLAGL